MRYWLNSGKKVKEVAQELGVSDWSLSRRHKEMETGNVALPRPVPASQSTEVNALELAKENGRLRRKNETLLRQREILPSAISIFSVQSPTGGLR